MLNISSFFLQYLDSGAHQPALAYLTVIHAANAYPPPIMQKVLKQSKMEGPASHSFSCPREQALKVPFSGV